MPDKSPPPPERGHFASSAADPSGASGGIQIVFTQPVNINNGMDLNEFNTMLAYRIKEGLRN
jgi:hypothetical protein